MNTNINLPDIAHLQQVANELFKALPNAFPKEISLNPSPAEHPRATKVAETLLNGFNGLNEDGLPIHDYDVIAGQTAITPPYTAPSLGNGSSLDAIPLGINSLGTNPLGNTTLKDIPLVENPTSLFPLNNATFGSIPNTLPAVGGVGASPSAFLKQAQVILLMP